MFAHLSSPSIESGFGPKILRDPVVTDVSGLLMNAEGRNKKLRQNSSSLEIE
jgi:hypothetical protein